MTTYTTFDGSNVQGVTLSGANLIATNASAGDNGVKSVHLKNSGKLYAEMLFNSLGGGNSGGGVVGTKCNYASMGSNGARAFMAFKNGGVFINTANPFNNGAVSGQTLCIAIDFAHNTGWLRVNGGNWNNSGSADPATNTGGVDISAITADGLLLTAMLTQSGETCTLNAGASAFAFTMPSGFTGWDNTTTEAGTTSYGNTGGTGDRTASITATSNLTISGTFNHIINGNKTENNMFFNGSSTGQGMKFDFGVGATKVIDRFRWYQSNSTAHGSAWQWYGSNDNSSFTALGNQFVLQGQSDSEPVEFFEPNANATGYRYYELRLITGSTSSSPWIDEIEFHVGDPAVTGVTGTWASTEAADIFNGTSAPSGTWASTEAKDLFAAAGIGPVIGPWASVEAKDVFNFTALDIGIDGFCHGQSTSSSITSGVLAALTTTQAHDVIVVCCSTKGGSISSITNTAGLTWTKRTKFNPTSDSTEDMEIWWAHAPTALTADVITIHFSSTNGFGAVAFGVCNANTAAPFDTHNANSITTDNGGSGNPSASITTDFTGNQLIFGYLGSDDGGGGITQGGGAVNTGMTTFLDHDANGDGNQRALVGYVLKPTHQTALSLSFTQNGGSGNNRFLMADCIVARVIITGSWNSTEAKDIWSATGYPQLTGAWASTEAKDIFNGTVYFPPRGTWGSTEAKDAMAGAGDVGAPLGIDALAEGGSHDASSGDVAITTSYHDEIIVLGILSGGFFARAKVSSITDTAGLVWKKRHQRWQLGVNPSMEIWWAKKTNPGATTITVNTAATTGFLAIQAIAITGARTSNPFDTHTGAGYYYDNLGSGNPLAELYSNTAHGMGLCFFGSTDVDSDTNVTSDFIWADRITVHENFGQSGRLEWAVQLFTSPYFKTPIQFGQVGGSSNNRALMTEVIVAANEPVGTPSTNDLIRWFFDGHGSKQILAMSGTNNSALQSFTTYNGDTVAVAAIMVQSSLGARVDHITDDAGHSAWTRRSIVTNDSGSLALEIWWCLFPAPFAGNVTVVLDSNVRPGDVLGFIVNGINGPDLFQRGEIWDGDPSLPHTNASSATSYQTDGPFSTLNENVLEVNFVANTSTDPTGFNQNPWLQFIGDFFGSVSGELVSSSPPFNIALDFKFSAAPVHLESVELDVSPRPHGWLMIADALPVGPVSPPQGVWGSVEAKDRFTHTGDFTAIGIASPGGWVGFPPNHYTLAATEAKDRATNTGAFTAIWDINGWIGYIPAFLTWHDTEAVDTASLHAWVLGPTTILARWESVESPDRLGFSGLHTFYTTPDSTGDRTSRITVTSNASIGGGDPTRLVDGVKSNGAGSAVFVNNAQTNPMFFTFDFGTPRVVTEAKWYQNGSSAQPGLWKWRGSNNGTTWTDLSATFVLNAGNTGAVIGDISANQTAYRYYQIIQTTTAGGNDTPWLWEIEFKVAGISGTMAALETTDWINVQYIVIPTATPIPVRKRRLLITS